MTTNHDMDAYVEMYEQLVTAVYNHLDPQTDDVSNQEIVLKAVKSAADKIQDLTDMLCQCMPFLRIELYKEFEKGSVLPMKPWLNRKEPTSYDFHIAASGNRLFAPAETFPCNMYSSNTPPSLRLYRQAMTILHPERK